MSTHFPGDRFALLVETNGTLCRPATADEIAGFIAWEATQPLSRRQRVRPKRKSERTHLDVVLVAPIRHALCEPHGVEDRHFLDGQIIIRQIRKSDLRCVNETEPMLNYVVAKFRESNKAWDER